MRILLVHNRYRSGAPSGENRVVDQEGEALEALGHEVMRFGAEQQRRDRAMAGGEESVASGPDGLEPRNLP